VTAPITAAFPPLHSFATTIPTFLFELLPFGPASAGLRHASEVEAPQRTFNVSDFRTFFLMPPELRIVLFCGLVDELEQRLPHFLHQTQLDSKGAC